MNNQHKTIEEIEAELGQQLRALRLNLDLDQISVSESAGVSLSAIKRLEKGSGATVKTLIKLLRFYGRTDWLESLSPPITISPLQMAKNKPSRQRAYSPRKKADK